MKNGSQTDVATAQAAGMAEGAGAVAGVGSMLAPVIDPRELIIDEARNGRRYPAKVEDMMVSLLEHGQETPIKVRTRPEIDGNGDPITPARLEVVFGFRRARAALQITEQQLQKEGEFFPLRYELVEMDDKKAFISNLVENRDRDNPSDVDQAHNIQRLKDEYGMTQKEVAKSLNVSEPWVTQTLKLLKLSAAEQKLVALHHQTGGKKGIAPATAYELAEMEPEERAAHLKELAGEGKKVTRSNVRKKKEETGGSNRGAQKSRTAKEIRITFEEVGTKIPEGGQAEPWQEWCADMVKFCTGKLSAKSLINKLRELGGTSTGTGKK